MLKLILASLLLSIPAQVSAAPAPKYTHADYIKLDAQVERCTVDVFSNKNYKRVTECVKLSKKLDKMVASCTTDIECETLTGISY